MLELLADPNVIQQFQVLAGMWYGNRTLPLADRLPQDYTKAIKMQGRSSHKTGRSAIKLQGRSPAVFVHCHDVMEWILLSSSNVMV